MQLQEGLSACNVLSSAIENPALWKTVFVPGFARSISPETFLDQLVVQFSLPQQCKEAEIDVYKYFCDFIVGSQYHGSGGNSITWLSPFSFLVFYNLIYLQLKSFVALKYTIVCFNEKKLLYITQKYVPIPHLLHAMQCKSQMLQDSDR